MLRRKRKMNRRTPTERFGYPCPVCGDGVVRPQLIDYVFRKGHEEYRVKQAQVGLCEHCGEVITPLETERRIDRVLKYSGEFRLRIDPELHARLAEAAERHHRSMTKEIEYRLVQSLAVNSEEEPGC